MAAAASRPAERATMLYFGGASPNKHLVSDARMIKIVQERLDSQKDRTIYVADGAARKPALLGRCLGNGASKRAIQLGDGLALLVPKIDSEDDEVASWWRNIVDEEVDVTNHFASLKLLTLSSRKVDLYSCEDASEDPLPAYVSESFESLAKTKGCYVIDLKDSDKSAWVKGTNFLFSSPEERLKVANWDRVLEPLVNDIAIICLHDLPANGDSLNLAIVNKHHAQPGQDEKQPTPEYVVRYMGFDFSGRDLFNLFKLDGPVDERIYEAKAFGYMYRILMVLLEYEFEKSTKESKALYNALLDKYPKLIAERVRKMKASERA